ncbi:AsnC family transcriptional regulator [Dactylosporangium sp. CS-033363]|uniref:AsnC family transcriptional regulator n=1 Tax=Dactylosporangium sp. CS-033363 TaxID=3239935 RepID=UPI003D8E217B
MPERQAQRRAGPPETERRSARDSNAGVDELDAATVGELQRNARHTNRDLAAAVGIAPSMGLNWVRALRERRCSTCSMRRPARRRCNGPCGA